jgi:hypothetical protein
MVSARRFSRATPALISSSEQRSNDPAHGKCRDGSLPSGEQFLRYDGPRLRCRAGCEDLAPRSPERIGQLLAHAVRARPGIQAKRIAATKFFVAMILQGALRYRNEQTIVLSWSISNDSYIEDHGRYVGDLIEGFACGLTNAATMKSSGEPKPSPSPRRIASDARKGSREVTLIRKTARQSDIRQRFVGILEHPLCVFYPAGLKPSVRCRTG